MMPDEVEDLSWSDRDPPNSARDARRWALLRKARRVLPEAVLERRVFECQWIRFTSNELYLSDQGEFILGTSE